MISGILLLTFAIDHYLFHSQYLVHIGGVKRDNGQSAALDEGSLRHEKEALKVESGQKYNQDKEGDSNSPASSMSWDVKAIRILLILFFYANSFYTNSDGTRKKKDISKSQGKAVESPSTKAVREEKVDDAVPRDVTTKLSWKIQILGYVVLLFAPLLMLSVFAFHLLFWLAVSYLVILLQFDFYEWLHEGTIVPRRFIAVESTLYLVIWTTLGAALLLKPTRLRGVLWKCFRWTPALTWWLLWTTWMFQGFGLSVAERVGSRIFTDVIMLIRSQFAFIERPLLAVYLYSGAVRDTAVAVRLCKYFWNNDVMKLYIGDEAAKCHAHMV